MIVVDALPGVTLRDGLGNLAWTLVAGFCVNVYIVGVNRLEDVEIDRVNKPYLPLASGELTRAAARRIVVGCALVAVALAVSQVWWRPSRCSPAWRSAPPTRRRRCASSASRCWPR